MTPHAEIERWLQARINRYPVASSIPMRDGYAAAVVAWQDRCRWARSIGTARGSSSIPMPSSMAAPRALTPAATSMRIGCEVFYAAMQLRLSVRASLLDVNNVNHGLLPSILLHCPDDQARLLFGPPRSGLEDFVRNAFLDIPAVVEACARPECRPLRTQPLIIAVVGADTGHLCLSFEQFRDEVGCSAVSE